LIDRLRQIGAMEIQDLHTLIVTADAGRFAGAAKVLGVDTSTISRRIGNLEDELGLSLFERDHAGVRLTRGGLSIVRCARRVLFHLDEVKRIGQQFASGSSGEIRLGVCVPPIGGPARALLSAWRVAYPNVRLTVVEANLRELALGLTEHRLEATLVIGRTSWPYVTAETLFKEQLVAALPSDHSLAQRVALDWKSLLMETILIQEWDDNRTPREIYVSVLGNDARFQSHAASKQTIMALVGTGAGVTLALDSQSEAMFPGVTFKPIEEDNAWLAFDLVWLPETEDPLLGRFIAFMRDQSRARGFV
jgi:DNA-binding transcriptional LysR family regulator